MTEDEPTSIYVQGHCHVLAAALHRHLGWDILLVLGSDFFWEDPEDPDNGIPEVIHAYAVDGQGMAWDIFGARPVESARKDAARRFLIDEASLDSDWLRGEAEMRMYVGEWADDGEIPIDRPLIEYNDDDVQAAWDEACRILAAQPGWGLPRATRNPAGHRP